MPYPNYHACRLREPSQFSEFRYKNQNGADVIMGKLKSSGEWSVQAIRYPKESWEEAAARENCGKHGGRFDAATGEAKNSLTGGSEPLPWDDSVSFDFSILFDYAVANPAQGNAATAQSAIATTFKATYADGLVSPGITIEQATAAFNNRHGVGATANLKWQSVRDFIVERSPAYHKARLLAWLEEGSLPDIKELWLGAVDEAADGGLLSHTKNSDGFVIRKVYQSAALGKTVTEEWATATDAQGIARPTTRTVTVT